MQIPYTSKAKKAVDSAAKLSKSMQDHYIGTEHILLGLLKEGTGVAALVLKENGVEMTAVLDLIKELIALSNTDCTGRKRRLFTESRTCAGKRRERSDSFPFRENRNGAHSACNAERD